MTSQPEWKDLKGKIKSQFGKLNDADIEGLHGHMDQLPNKIQKVYGYDKKKAEQVSKTFTDSLNR